MRDLPGAAVLGPDPARLAIVLVWTALFVAILASLWRSLRKRKAPEAGIVFELGFITVPAGAVCSLLILYGYTSDSGPWRAVLSIALLSVSHVIFSLVDHFLFVRGRGPDGFLAAVPKIFRDSLRWALLVVAFFVILGAVWDFHISELSILAGALSIALSLALGPTLGSMISGITLISERPFEIGDWIDVDGKQGRVEQITWRSTRIVTRDRERVVYPNSLLAAHRLVNLSRPEKPVGVRARVGVHYRTPPVAAEDALRRAVLGVPGILGQPETTFRIVEFGESAVTWEVRFFVDHPEILEAVRGEVMRRIWYSLRRADIEIPYPIRNVVMRDGGWDRGHEGPEGEGARVLRNADLLRRIPVFEGLPKESLRRLAAAARDETYLHGERIIIEGEKGDRMFVLVGGRVRVVSGPDGATQQIAVLEAGSYFGEMSLLTGAPRLATVAAEGLVEAIALAAPALAVELREHPEFAQRMADSAVARRSALEQESTRLRESRMSQDVPVTSPTILGGIIRFFGLDREEPPKDRP